jgi:hypothetical protein
MLPTLPASVIGPLASAPVSVTAHVNSGVGLLDAPRVDTSQFLDFVCWISFEV